MEAIPYELAGAVKDLHDLFQQINPAGPFRLALFHDREKKPSDKPEWFTHEAAQIDSFIRGAACLLANDLAETSTPVTAIAWRHVKSTSFRIGFASQPEPAYFSYLSKELNTVSSHSKTEAYRLFGEVLAIYLDMLCNLGFDSAGSVGPRIDKLREIVISTGADSHVEKLPRQE